MVVSPGALAAVPVGAGLRAAALAGDRSGAGAGGAVHMGSPLYDAFAMERTDEPARPAVIGLINGAYSIGYPVAPRSARGCSSSMASGRCSRSRSSAMRWRCWRNTGSSCAGHAGDSPTRRGSGASEVRRCDRGDIAAASRLWEACLSASSARVRCSASASPRTRSCCHPCWCITICFGWAIYAAPLKARQHSTCTMFARLHGRCHRVWAIDAALYSG